MDRGTAESDQTGRFRLADLTPGELKLTLSGERLNPLQTQETVQAVVAMLWFSLGTKKRVQAVRVLRRSATCHRGHRKVVGQKGCGQCMTAYWRIRRSANASPNQPIVGRAG